MELILIIVVLVLLQSARECDGRVDRAQVKALRGAA